MTKLVESLSSSVREFDCYYYDQNAHVNTFPHTHGVENNGKMFWVFGGLDYKNWIQSKEELSVLVLRGSPALEHAASHVVRTLKKNKLADVVLHFFYSSTKSMVPPYNFANLQYDWRHVSCVWTFLIQVIDGYPLSQRQFLFTAFFNQVILRMKYGQIENMPPDDPLKAFELLLGHILLDDLWFALAQVLAKSEELGLGDIEAMQRSTTHIKRNLAVVLDLDDLSIETYRMLIDSIRGTLRNLRRYFAVLKVLITNPPPRGDLQLQESEVLLEYDEERRGSC